MIEAANPFITTHRGLDANHPALRLWHKAKKLGTWDPMEVDLARDQRDWRGLHADERDALLNLTALFEAGEEAVTVELVPLLNAIAAEHRLEEEMYLTSFLWEEAKHVETFHRFLTEVAGIDQAGTRDLSAYHVPSYRKLFYEELPSALGRLRHDTSPAALAAASVTYNMIVEGVLAETGYHGYYQMLEVGGIMPGMRTLIANVKRDESRHIAYGVFLLSRLVAEHGEPIWEVIDKRISELLLPSVTIISEGLSRYSPIPFGLDLDELVQYAMSQFQSRYQRIERSRHQSLEQVYRAIEGEASVP